MRFLLALFLPWLLFSPAKAQVERANFDTSPFSLGVLTERDGALPRELWQGADAQDIRQQLEALPTRFADPAKQLMLRRVLLSPGEGPVGADGELAGLKLLKAAEAGFVHEAAALAELTPGLVVQPSLTQVVAYRDLLRGQIDNACQRGASLREGRQRSFFVRLRALCYLHADERPAAELTLSLAREEGVLSRKDEVMFRGLLLGRPVSQFPENAVQYAAYRMLQGLFTGDDVADLAPAVAVAVALDPGLSASAREAALIRAAREDLLPSRELGGVAMSLNGAAIGGEVARIRSMIAGSEERETAIGSLLNAAKEDPDAFLLRSKIFEAEIASAEPGLATVPYAAEFALSALVLRKFDSAEAWMQALASEQSLGAERAFVNLAKLYSYIQPGAAQRLAGAIGEQLPEPPEAVVTVADPLAAGQGIGTVALLAENALAAARSGNQGSALLTALGASALSAEGQLAEVRDALAYDLYDQAEASIIAQEASFRREALAFAGKLRDETINQQAFVPRIKPER